MPVIYPKKIRKAFRTIDLEVLKNEIINNGFTFIRDGAFRPEDEPFKFSNYLFYINNETGMNLRIGYNYPLLKLNGNEREVIFEICYCPKNYGWWLDITPDFRKNEWRIISDNYKNI